METAALNYAAWFGGLAALAVIGVFWYVIKTNRNKQRGSGGKGGPGEKQR